jgi:hypothetical protein
MKEAELKMLFFCNISLSQCQNIAELTHAILATWRRFHHIPQAA